MGQPDPRIERYLSTDRPWRRELVALREVLLEEELEEALKWRQPCYSAHGANVAILAAMEDCVAVSFFKGVLLDDPDGRLEAPGPNSRSARYMRFRTISEIEAEPDRLRVFIRQAVENERRGLKVDLPKDDLELPDALVEAMDADPAFADAFEALTPGRQRGYVIYIGGAKKAETRKARVEKWRGRIMNGKGMHDR